MGYIQPEAIFRSNQSRGFGYDMHGRVVQEWGSAAYPVERVCCSCGKMAQLRTFRGGTGWDGAAWPAATTGAFDKTTRTYRPRQSCVSGVSGVGGCGDEGGQGTTISAVEQRLGDRR